MTANVTHRFHFLWTVRNISIKDDHPGQQPGVSTSNFILISSTPRSNTEGSAKQQWTSLMKRPMTSVKKQKRQKLWLYRENIHLARSSTSPRIYSLWTVDCVVWQLLNELHTCTHCILLNGLSYSTQTQLEYVLWFIVWVIYMYILWFISGQ